MADEIKVPAEVTPAPPVPEAPLHVDAPVIPVTEKPIDPDVPLDPVEPPSWLTKSPLYATLVWIACVVLPASAILVGCIGGSMSWSGTIPTMTVLAGLATFSGTVLGLHQTTK